MKVCARRLALIEYRQLAGQAEVSQPAARVITIVWRSPCRQDERLQLIRALAELIERFSQSQQFRDRDFTCPVVPMLDAPSSSIHAETWGVSMFAGQAEGCFELVLQGATMPWDPL
jgi:hypothetical protein